MARSVQAVEVRVSGGFTLPAQDKFPGLLPYSELYGSPPHPRCEKKLNELLTQSARGTDELLQDALAAYFNEMVQIRETIDSRYDKLKSGPVKPIDGEQAFSRLKAKTEAQRKRSTRAAAPLSTDILSPISTTYATTLHGKPRRGQLGDGGVL